jgi:hypothetical protein
VERTLGAIDSPALHLYRYLWQGRWGGTIENSSPFGRIEDRAMAGTEQLSVLVDYCAPLVRAHGRVGRELPGCQVDEHSRVPQVREVYSRARGDSGDLSDLLASCRRFTT